ncbi:hypothetical protein ES703_92382 [subsurface metagenome]
MYKNPKELMDAATALPVAIEAKLPEGAPKISEGLFKFNADILAKAPDFLMEIPDLPAVPEFPELPGAPELGRRYVTGVEVMPVPTPAATPKPRAASAVGGGRIIEGRGF